MIVSQTDPPVSGNGGVRYHDGLQVESAVRNKDDGVRFASKDRGGTAKDLTRRERLCLNGRGSGREAGLCLLFVSSGFQRVPTITWVSDGFTIFQAHVTDYGKGSDHSRRFYQNSLSAQHIGKGEWKMLRPKVQDPPALWQCY